MNRILHLSFIFFVNLLSWAGAQTSQAYQFSLTTNGNPTFWYTSCISFWMNTSGSQGLNNTMVERDLISSLNAWDSIECSALSLSYKGQTNSNFIGYDTSEGAENQNILTFVSSPQAWLYDPNALALTTVTMCVNDTPECAVGTIIDADIEINEQGYPFTTSDAPRVRMDLANTLTHEIGHLLGLDHSNDAEATMYFQQDLGETNKRNLANDDRLALCTLFPTDDERACNMDAYSFGIQPETTQATDSSTTSSSEGCEQAKSYHLIFNLLILLLITIMFRARLRSST